MQTNVDTYFEAQNVTEQRPLDARAEGAGDEGSSTWRDLRRGRGNNSLARRGRGCHIECLLVRDIGLAHAAQLHHMDILSGFCDDHTEFTKGARGHVSLSLPKAARHPAPDQRPPRALPHTPTTWCTPSGQIVIQSAALPS